MNEQVWVSRGQADTSLNLMFKDAEDKLTFRDLVQVKRDLYRGVPVDPKLLPTNLIFDEKKGNAPMRMPHVFSWTTLYVSEAFASVLTKCDLGRTRLIPVTLFGKSMQVMSDRSYFSVVFGEARKTVGGGRGLIENTLQPGEFSLDSPLEDGAVEVFPDIPAQLDIWVDPNIHGAVFLSDRLQHALHKKDVARRLSLRRCATLTR